MRARWLVLALAIQTAASAFVGAPRRDDSETLVRARALVEQKDFGGAAQLLQERLKRAAGDASELEMLGTVLLQLARSDEAADYLEQAIKRYEADGKTDKAKSLAALLHRADPLATRRDAFLKKIVDTLYTASEELAKAGHAERALAILERLPPAAPTVHEAQRVEALLATIRAQFEEVHLDEAGSSKPASGVWPLVEHESKQYRFACNLEPEVVDRLGTVMDDLHHFYVQVYFDGDARKAAGEKPLIRIHPDKPTMLEGWQGESAPEGWWSPGDNQVTAYDTRSMDPARGTLDVMLVTLFHEASHQFMTLISRGGYTPAWLNEGTATFFEGTTAMADGKVLWPGAAQGRLQNLVTSLDKGTPTARDAVAYEGAGSYGGEYYPFGWGLCYFLQQYEEPQTLKFVYRPLYAEYRSRIVKRGGDSLKLFEEVFLGKASPLGHETFDDFERDWKAWIRTVVQPLNGSGAEARKLRMERVERYLAAASGAKSKSKQEVGEEELLRRALGDVEYVRARIDKEDEPDGHLLVLQADLLMRLKRDKAAAPLLEKALDLADQGKYEIASQRYDEMEKRLAQVDRRNAALRSARSRTTGLARAAAGLLADYRAKPGFLLRGYTFAVIAGGALQDEQGLLAAAAEMRPEVRSAGLLHGSIKALSTDPQRLQARSRSSTPTNRFEGTPGGVLIECVRAAEFVDPDIVVVGEYELRARLARVGEPEPGSVVGLVVAGRIEDDWTMIGIDERGHVGVWVAQLTGRNTDRTGSVLRRSLTLFAKPPIDITAPIDVSVRVGLDGRIVINVPGTEPLETRLALDPAVARHVGVFAKNTVATFSDVLVELYP